MLNLALSGFILMFLVLGIRRPFLWVLAYIYIDSLAPQRISWGFLQSIPISLISFVLAFGWWALSDAKEKSRFTFRQGLIAFLILYCGLTTISADFYESALGKWSWVWRALLFAIFLPLTLTTRLRIESTALVMVLTIGAIIINGAIKTLAGGSGYGTLMLFVDDNFGLYESSIISVAAISVIPLIFWLMKHGTIFPPDWRVKFYGIALAFSCLLISIGTQARTGILCMAALFILLLRTTKRRVLYIALIAAGVLVSIPLLPKSYIDRMNTIGNHASDQSASTRVAVWMWTIDYAKAHPLGGGFAAYRGNTVRIELKDTKGSGNNVSVETRETFDRARAYHSSYFEMLGEQGWPGLLVWLTLMVSGLVQMELISRRWKKRTGPGGTWQAPLASALQQSLLVYMVGSLFVGIAFQPFCYMLIGLQCGLWSYLKRIDSEKVQIRLARPRLSIGNAVAAP